MKLFFKIFNRRIRPIISALLLMVPFCLYAQDDPPPEGLTERNKLLWDALFNQPELYTDIDEALRLFETAQGFKAFEERANFIDHPKFIEKMNQFGTFHVDFVSRQAKVEVDGFREKGIELNLVRYLETAWKHYVKSKLKYEENHPKVTPHAEARATATLLEKYGAIPETTSGNYPEYQREFNRLVQNDTEPSVTAAKDLQPTPEWIVQQVETFFARIEPVYRIYLQALDMVYGEDFYIGHRQSMRPLQYDEVKQYQFRPKVRDSSGLLTETVSWELLLPSYPYSSITVNINDIRLSDPYIAIPNYIEAMAHVETTSASGAVNLRARLIPYVLLHIFEAVNQQLAHVSSYYRVKKQGKDSVQLFDSKGTFISQIKNPTNKIPLIGANDPMFTKEKIFNPSAYNSYTILNIWMYIKSRPVFRHHLYVKKRDSQSLVQLLGFKRNVQSSTNIQKPQNKPENIFNDDAPENARSRITNTSKSDVENQQKQKNYKVMKGSGRDRPLFFVERNKADFSPDHPWKKPWSLWADVSTQSIDSFFIPKNGFSVLTPVGYALSTLTLQDETKRTLVLGEDYTVLEIPGREGYWILPKQSVRATISAGFIKKQYSELDLKNIVIDPTKLEQEKTKLRNAGLGQLVDQIGRAQNAQDLSSTYTQSNVYTYQSESSSGREVLDPEHYEYYSRFLYQNQLHFQCDASNRLSSIIYQNVLPEGVQVVYVTGFTEMEGYLTNSGHANVELHDGASRAYVDHTPTAKDARDDAPVDPIVERAKREKKDDLARLDEVFARTKSSYRHYPTEFNRGRMFFMPLILKRTREYLAGEISFEAYRSSLHEKIQFDSEALTLSEVDFFRFLRTWIIEVSTAFQKYEEKAFKTREGSKFHPDIAWAMLVQASALSEAFLNLYALSHPEAHQVPEKDQRSWNRWFRELLGKFTLPLGPAPGRSGGPDYYSSGPAAGLLVLEEYVLTRLTEGWRRGLEAMPERLRTWVKEGLRAYVRDVLAKVRSGGEGVKSEVREMLLRIVRADGTVKREALTPLDDQMIAELATEAVKETIEGPMGDGQENKNQEKAIEEFRERFKEGLEKGLSGQKLAVQQVEFLLAVWIMDVVRLVSEEKSLGDAMSEAMHQVLSAGHLKGLAAFVGTSTAINALGMVALSQAINKDVVAQVMMKPVMQAAFMKVLGAVSLFGGLTAQQMVTKIQGLKAIQELAVMKYDWMRAYARMDKGATIMGRTPGSEAALYALSKEGGSGALWIGDPADIRALMGGFNPDYKDGQVTVLGPWNYAFLQKLKLQVMNPGDRRLAGLRRFDLGDAIASTAIVLVSSTASHLMTGGMPVVSTILTVKLASMLENERLAQVSRITHTNDYKRWMNARNQEGADLARLVNEISPVGVLTESFIAEKIEPAVEESEIVWKEEEQELGTRGFVAQAAYGRFLGHVQNLLGKKVQEIVYQKDIEKRELNEMEFKQAVQTVSGHLEYIANLWERGRTRDKNLCENPTTYIMHDYLDARYEKLLEELECSVAALRNQKWRIEYRVKSEGSLKNKLEKLLEHDDKTRSESAAQDTGLRIQVPLQLIVQDQYMRLNQAGNQYREAAYSLRTQMRNFKHIGALLAVSRSVEANTPGGEIKNDKVLVSRLGETTYVDMRVPPNLMSKKYGSLVLKVYGKDNKFIHQQTIRNNTMPENGSDEGINPRDVKHFLKFKLSTPKLIPGQTYWIFVHSLDPVGIDHKHAFEAKTFIRIPYEQESRN